YRPYDYITGDMTPNYQFYSDAIIVDTTFRNSKYLGSSSRAAYYLILLGTICAALTFFSLFVLVGATIWTIIIKKSDSINNIIIGSETNPSPLGITVSTGPAAAHTADKLAAGHDVCGPFIEKKHESLRLLEWS
ncbi:hypothetical protein MPER_03823, partial [Moniliophthora perniciosa FA553]